MSVCGKMLLIMGVMLVCDNVESLGFESIFQLPVVIKGWIEGKRSTDGGKFNLWFKEADKDNDGLLSRSELKAKSLTDEEIDFIMEKYDKSGDGKLSKFDEFDVTAMKKITQFLMLERLSNAQN